MAYTSDEERHKARPVGFCYAEYKNNRVKCSYGKTEELEFCFEGEPWVEGNTPDGQRLRLQLSEVDRFDIDTYEREGDDKTHHYYFMLIGAGDRQLIYYERQPEYVYHPIPGLTRKDIVEDNLGAIAHLCNLACMRSQFGKTEPWKAFRKEGDTGPPKTPEERQAQDKADTSTGLAIMGCCVVTIVVAIWVLWKRISTRP